MNLLRLLVLLVSLPLLLGGCGGDKKEPVAEVKPVEEAPVNPNLKYEIKDDEVTITDCDTGASGKLVIPATIEGKSVTSIGRGVFGGCGNLTSITIPDSVTSIGAVAFGNCSSLTTIEVGAENVNYTAVNGVLFNKEKTELITYSAGKTGANYTIPEDVTSIGWIAFYNCGNLTSITIPDSVMSIGDDAFYECGNLTSITIPDSVTSIGGGTFSGCKSLTSITIPDSVTSIGAGAFSFSESLTSITIPDSVTSIGEKTFLFCTSLTNITFGEKSKLTSIGSEAFSWCTSLTSITIPDSVTSIRSGAFKQCKSLTAVTFLGNAPEAGEEVFLRLRAPPTIYRKPEAKGWGDKWSGRPVKLISEKP